MGYSTANAWFRSDCAWCKVASASRGEVFCSVHASCASRFCIPSMSFVIFSTDSFDELLSVISPHFLQIFYLRQVKVVE